MIPGNNISHDLSIGRTIKVKSFVTSLEKATKNSRKELLSSSFKGDFAPSQLYLCRQLTVWMSDASEINYQ